MFLDALEKISVFLKVDFEELPVDIYTTNGESFPLCFYFAETSDCLIVFATQDDGKEKLVAIAKSQISCWNVVYQQDIDELMAEDPDRYNKVKSYEQGRWNEK